MSISGSGAAAGAVSGAQAGSAFGPWGTAIGAGLGGILGAFSAKKKKAAPTAPFVPLSAPTPINVGEEQHNALAANLSAEGDIESLLARSNRFQQGQASDLLEKAIPGYGRLSQSILSRGQEASDNPYDLPPEVQQNLTRIAAERGISVGNRGQSGKFSALRDLGVNMLDYGNQNFQKSLQALQTVTGLAPRISPMSPLSFYLNPAQAIGTAAGNQSALYQTNLYNNQGAQATAQGRNNAETAASNFNSQNSWDTLIQAIGMIPSVASKSAGGSGPKMNLSGLGI